MGQYEAENKTSDISAVLMYLETTITNENYMAQ